MTDVAALVKDVEEFVRDVVLPIEDAHGGDVEAIRGALPQFRGLENRFTVVEAAERSGNIRITFSGPFRPRART